MPLGIEVGLGPFDVVLDGARAPGERGTAAPSLFSGHVYCGHGRPSQLLQMFYHDQRSQVSWLIGYHEMYEAVGRTC